VCIPYLPPKKHYSFPIKGTDGKQGSRSFLFFLTFVHFVSFVFNQLITAMRAIAAAAFTGWLGHARNGIAAALGKEDRKFAPGMLPAAG
jgi:hypothetical protein